MTASIHKSAYVKTGYQVQLRFSLSQHIRDKDLFENFVKYFGFGYTAENREGVYFLVTKLSDLKDKFLPTLLSLEYPVVGYKYIDFLYFKEAVEIMDKKLHLTEEGLNKLREIRQLLNSPSFARERTGLRSCGRENIPSEDTGSTD